VYVDSIFSSDIVSEVIAGMNSNSIQAANLLVVIFLLLAFTAIECSFFQRQLNVSWIKSYGLMFVTKTVAFIPALIFSVIAVKLPFIITVFPLTAIIGAYIWVFSKNKKLAIAIVIVVAALLVLAIVDSLQYPRAYDGMPVVLGFPGIYALTEGYFVRKVYKIEDPWKPLLKVKTGSFVLFIIVAMIMPGLLNSSRAAWMSRAKGTLRSIGSAELSYQGHNKGKFYGSFKALQDSQDIATGYTLGNMIENYSMEWQVNNISTGNSDDLPSGDMRSFVVIAWPRDKSPGYLNTFAITDDQVVRVYNPDNGNNLEDIKSWDPIL
jgi:hypothetical protein